jgi:hypothetical protein
MLRWFAPRIPDRVIGYEIQRYQVLFCLRWMIWRSESDKLRAQPEKTRSMNKQIRRQHSPQDKVRILRLHLLEAKTDLRDLRAEGIHPTLFYQWQKTFSKLEPPPLKGGGPLPECWVKGSVSWLRQAARASN